MTMSRTLPFGQINLNAFFDLSERLLQGTPASHVNETQVAPNFQTTAPITKDAILKLDSKTFIKKAGQHQNFVIPPAEHKAMSPKEHLAALVKIQADRGLPPKVPGSPRDCRCRGAPPDTTSSPTNTIFSYAEVVDPLDATGPPSVVSGVTQPGAPPASSSNSLCQVLSSNRAPPSNPSSGDDTNSGANDTLVSFDGHFCRRVNSASVSHTLSNHDLTPIFSSLVLDGVANGHVAGNDVQTLLESSFNKANVTQIRESLVQNLPLASDMRAVLTLIVALPLSS